MRKIIVFFIVIIISSISLYSEINTEIIDKGIDVSYIRDMDYKEGKAVFLNLEEDLSGHFDRSNVIRINLKDYSWEKLPDSIFAETEFKHILTSKYSNVKIGPKGDIWVGAKSAVYKYSNDEWSEISIDDQDKDKRSYENLCFDTNDNLWVTTSVGNDKGTLNGYSELLKYNGEDFEQILRFESIISFRSKSNLTGSVRSLASTTDGKIIATRRINLNEENVNMDSLFNVYVIDSDDGSYVGKQVRHANFESYPDALVSDILALDANDIWFALDHKTYIDLDGGKNVSCCSGLTHFKDGEWIVFSESNNFNKINETKYPRTASIIKLPENKFLVTALEHNFIEFLKFNENKVLNRFDYSDILNKSVFIPFNNYYTGEKAVSFLSRLLPDAEIPLIYTKHITYTKDDKLLIPVGKGLLIYKGNILSVKEENKTGNLIYPNPAKEFLRIDNYSNYNKYKIVDVNGIVLKTGYVSGEINVGKLTSGMYFLRLYDHNNIIENYKFIKR